NTCYTTDCEQEDEGDRPQHGITEGNGPAPHGCNPGEDLDARRNCNHHRREDEITLRVERDTTRIHVVCPHDEADRTDCHHGVGHSEIAEYRLPGECGDDVADNAEARQDHDVHFRVP